MNGDFFNRLDVELAELTRQGAHLTVGDRALPPSASPGQARRGVRAGSRVVGGGVGQRVSGLCQRPCSDGAGTRGAAAVNAPSVADPTSDHSRVRGLVELVVTVAVAVGAALLIQAFLVKPYRIPSSSMFPTLEQGQRILVNRLSTHPGIGDIVVFHPPSGADSDFGRAVRRPANRARGTPSRATTRLQRASSQTFVKRVVGLPGDTLEISHGDVYRNGTREPGAYIQPCPDAVELHVLRNDHRPQGPLLHDG